MDPLTTIIIALGTGATVQATATSTNAKVKEIYQELSKQIQHKFETKHISGQPLTEYAKAPSISKRRKILKEALVEAEIDKDAQIVETAQELLERVEPEQVTPGKYEVKVKGTVQGCNEGNYQQVIMNFGSESREQRKFG